MLERNMSLSGQYLEELSRRYKRQVDDMQKNLNRTMQVNVSSDAEASRAELWSNHWMDFNLP